MFLIYKLTNPHTNLSYVGLTKDLKNRIYKHKKTNIVECNDFTVEVLFDNIPSRAEANEMEKVFIYVHDTFHNGYNKTRGGGYDYEYTEETKKKISDANKKRVDNGTHHFLGDNNPGPISNQHRIDNGTHHFLGDSHPVYKLLKDGTHPFLGSNHAGVISSRNRVLDGTHHFLGDNNPSHKRVKDGTHHLLGDNHPIRRNPEKVSGDNHWKRKKRLKAEWMWIRLLAMCWYEMHRYVMKRREEFYNKEIVDTSNATQISMF